MKEQTDINLIKSAKRDPDKFALLYEKYYKRIYNYLYFHLDYDKEAAKDLTQDTFLRAFEDLIRFEDRGYTYLAYLLRIAHNLLINHVRTPRRLVSLEKIPEISDSVSVSQNINLKLQAEAVWGKISRQLSTSAKGAMLMKYSQDMSIRDIAQALGKSENAVKIMLYRSRKKLQEHSIIISI